jgi:serine/threonine protein kinase
VFEQEGIVHGDLSPNNIVIDIEARPDQPALYLIDFDAFVAPAAEGNAVVTVAEGGTFGTEGYCPPDLAAAAAAGDGSAAPFSDRYGRDMLLVELLVLDGGLSPDDPPSSWNREHLECRFAAWQARSDPKSLQTLAHLDPTTLFTLAEQDRPAAKELAAALGLSLPTKRMLRRMTRVWSSTPAVLGNPLASARIDQLSRRSPSTRSRPAPATLHFIVPWRWSRPASDPRYRTLWQDIKTAMGCFAILLLPFLVALIIVLGKLLNDRFMR